MNKKNKLKAIVAFAVALAFILPTSAVFANENDVTLSSYIDEDFEGTIPPSGWDSYYSSYTGGIPWDNNVNMGLPNLAGGDGNCAGVKVYDNPMGMPGNGNAWISTPAIDLSSASGAQLEFTVSYTKLGMWGGQFEAQIEVDGAPWVTMLSWGSSHDPAGPGETVTINLMPYLISFANENVKIRWTVRYDGQFLIDQVTIVDTTIVSIDPLGTTVNDGDSFTVDVYVEPDVPISGVQFDLYFDPTIVQAVSVIRPPGDIFNGHTVTFDDGTINNSIGTIDDVYLTVLDSDPCPTDPGIFVTISFTALNKFDTSPLDLDAVGAIDYWGDPVPVSVNDGTVTVEPIWYTLDITVDPSVAGTVTAVPLPDHGDYYAEGTSVELTAVNASVDWEFKEWQGDLSGSTNPQTIVMNSDKAVTARFSGPGWESTMTFVGDITLARDTVVFGESTEASDDEDDMDVPKPASPGAPYIYAYLERTDLPDPYDILWEEYRFHDVDNDLQVWDLVVETDNGGGSTQIEVTITWNKAALNTAQYDNIGLYGLSGNLLKDMKASNWYAFTADSGTPDRFQIRCTDNHAPVAYPDSYETLESHELNVPESLGVLANDFDVDGDTLTAINTTGPTDGMLTFNTDGSFDYMPDLGFFGTDTFMYKANDGDLDSNEVTVTIKVVRLNRISIRDGWNLFSIPVGENIDKTTIIVKNATGVDYTWADAISEGIILGFTYGWNGGYTGESILVPGEGYWMWAYEDCDLLIPSNVEADNHITYLDVGWNLVGVHKVSLAKLDVIVQYDGDWLSWDTAVGEDVILDFIYLWHRGGQYYVLGDTFLSSHGCWVYAYEGCALKEPLP